MVKSADVLRLPCSASSDQFACAAKFVEELDIELILWTIRRLFRCEQVGSAQ